MFEGPYRYGTHLLQRIVTRCSILPLSPLKSMSISMNFPIQGPILAGFGGCLETTELPRIVHSQVLRSVELVGRHVWRPFWYRHHTAWFENELCVSNQLWTAAVGLAAFKAHHKDKLVSVILRRYGGGIWKGDSHSQLNGRTSRALLTTK